MDYGDDPLMSTRYASEHTRAHEALQPEHQGHLRALKSRSAWKDKPLDELRGVLVTPDMMVAAKCSWGALQAKHGAAALIDFGFRWPTMLAAGFDASHLSSLTHPQLASLGLTAPRMLECRPRARHLSALNCSADDLRNQGWNEDLLAAIGIDMASMVAFGFSLPTWRDTLGVGHFGKLGFTNYAECARMGWCDRDIRLALAAHAAPAPAALAHSAAPNGKIRFI